MMSRLKMLLLPNNHISFIEQGLGKKLPNLRSIILTNNKISELSVIDALAGEKENGYTNFIILQF